MWIMWLFSVVIPLGVVHSLISGEISVGVGSYARGAARVLRFDDNPVGFIVMLGALCVLEIVLVVTLLRARREHHAVSPRRGVPRAERG